MSNSPHSDKSPSGSNVVSTDTLKDSLLTGTEFDDTDDVDRAAVGVMHTFVAEPGTGPIEFGFNLMQRSNQFQQPSFHMPTKPPQKHVSGARPAPYKVEIAPGGMELEEMEQEGDVDHVNLFASDDLGWDITSQMSMEPDDGSIQLLEEHEFGCKTAVITSRSADDAVQAVLASTLQLEGSGREITYEHEGYSVQVNFTEGSNYSIVEISLLETGDDHPTSPDHIAILYNKLRGDSYTFQRFYRESVNKLKNDLADLKPLNGKYLPSVDVMVDNFDRSDVPKAKESTISQAIESVLLFLKPAQKEIENLRQATATIQTLSQTQPMEVIAAGAKNKGLTMNLASVFRENHNDFDVAFNISRTFNALVDKDQFYDGKFELLRQIHDARLFDCVAESAVWWTAQEGESKAFAKQLESSFVVFLNNIFEGYYGQGNRVTQNARSALLKLAGQTKTEFTRLQKTAEQIKNVLRL